MNTENSKAREYVTVLVAGQLFGVPVLSVRDVLREQPLTPIPLASPEIVGALNLRGRVVTAIDLRTRLGLPPREEGASSMNLVVALDGELYSFLVDEVGDVLKLDMETYEVVSDTLEAVWAQVTMGLHRLDKDLMLVLDIEAVLGDRGAEEAA